MNSLIKEKKELKEKINNLTNIIIGLYDEIEIFRGQIEEYKERIEEINSLLEE